MCNGIEWIQSVEDRVGILQGILDECDILHLGTRMPYLAQTCGENDNLIDFSHTSEKIIHTWAF